MQEFNFAPVVLGAGGWRGGGEWQRWGERLFMHLYLFAFVQFITWMKDVTKKNLEWVFYVHIKINKPQYGICCCLSCRSHVLQFAVMMSNICKDISRKVSSVN